MAQTEESRFDWTRPRTEAAKLIAEGGQTNAAIAATVGVDVTTLFRWEKVPAFAARVEEQRAILAEEAINHAVSRRAHRLGILQEKCEAIQALMAARAEEYEEIPGGSTGLIVRQTKIAGRATVTEYAFDAALMRELRELLRAAAIEAGQWSEKREVTGANGGPVEIAATRARLIARFAALNAGEGDSD